jgi:hypothetical protein
MFAIDKFTTFLDVGPDAKMGLDALKLVEYRWSIRGQVKKVDSHILQGCDSPKINSAILVFSNETLC